MNDFIGPLVRQLALRLAAAIGISVGLLIAAVWITATVVHARFDHHSKPDVQLVAPPAPACKVCHCGKTSCHRDCGEEAMCNARCEGLCRAK